MKTEDLIAAMAADTLPQQTVGQRLARALPVALAVSVAGFAVFWGPRPDLGAALASAAVLKPLVPLGLVIVAGVLCVALAHPGQSARTQAAALGLFAAALAAAFVVAFSDGGVSGLVNALDTTSLVTCLLSIPALALPLMGAVFWALSAGAALRPRLAGAAAGLVAGGLSAALYSFYCDQDAALFVLPAYSTAVLILALIGAVLGPRLLKW
jgi:hypothetical protein